MAQSSGSQPVNPNPTSPREETFSFKGFSQFARNAFNAIIDIFDIVVEPFFKIRESGRIVRSALFVIGFFIWMFVAYAAHPPDLVNFQPWFNLTPTETTPEQIQLMMAVLATFQLVAQAFVALLLPFFAPDIFRHVLVIGLASWIAYQWAAIYLDDIFELKNTEISRKFIWKAAFVGQLEKVRITDGDVAATDKDSHVVKIGGPGQVIVHLENAVLFEKINGEPHIITSEDKGKTIRLDGFERLRTVKYSNKPGESYAIFDRRDQILSSGPIVGRTKDGIAVTAKNVSAVFSIHEGQVTVAEPPEMNGGNGKIVTPQISRRVSFDRDALETAIQNLVYNQTNRPWTETAKQNIFPSVRTWIGLHTLDEFLTNLSPQELAEVRERLQTLGGQSPLPTPNPIYLSRAELTNYVQGNPDNWKGRGFDVHWVGVGTWETPEEIPQQHRKAFELSVENRIMGSEMEISRLHRTSRIKELVRLIRDVPIHTYKQSLQVVNRKTALGGGLFGSLIGGDLGDALSGEEGHPHPEEAPGRILPEHKDVEALKYKLMLAYREKLKNARDWYERNHQSVPEELSKTIEHLSDFHAPDTSSSSNATPSHRP